MVLQHLKFWTDVKNFNTDISAGIWIPVKCGIPVVEKSSTIWSSFYGFV